MSLSFPEKGSNQSVVVLLGFCLQVKCDQYWPSRGTETYGTIQVTMLDTVELAAYVIRSFTISKVKSHMCGGEALVLVGSWNNTFELGFSLGLSFY